LICSARTDTPSVPMTMVLFPMGKCQNSGQRTADFLT
jgi:hypothetical protein